MKLVRVRSALECLESLVDANQIAQKKITSTWLTSNRMHSSNILLIKRTATVRSVMSATASPASTLLLSSRKLPKAKKAKNEQPNLLVDTATITCSDLFVSELRKLG